MAATFHSLPFRQLHLRPGSPMNGVLEGGETLAGGETTGSSATPTLSSRRAPAGAREACGDSTSPSSAHFSRPSRALPSSTMGTHAKPVVSLRDFVAPPANLSRAFGTPTADHFPESTKMVVTSAA